MNIFISSKKVRLNYKYNMKNQRKNMVFKSLKNKRINKISKDLYLSEKIIVLAIMKYIVKKILTCIRQFVFHKNHKYMKLKNLFL